MKKLAVAVLLIGLILTEPYLSTVRISLGLEQSGPVSISEFFLRFLGEIRYTIASYLWLDVEIYHHELGLTELPSRVGTQDPKKVGEILAICKLVTRLDPQFVQAYDVGAWRLIHGLGKFKEGIDFLNEGISNNPESALLYDDMGVFYFFYLKDCIDAVPYLKKAVELSGKDKYIKGDDLRILANCHELQGERENALKAWREVLEIFPHDTPAKFHIKRLENK